ncbi:hypothetical protein HDV06_001742 [Boothiomyces sp. JEL0866]|nr:hypothetical protein HDV06_001742 [Boothiomyces sp. JEL0866]
MDSTTLASVCVIAVTFIVLVGEAGYLIRDLNSWRIAPIGLFAQVALCATRAFTLLIELLIPGVNCVLLGNLGMTVYESNILLLIVDDTKKQIRHHSQNKSAGSEMKTRTGKSTVNIVYGKDQPGASEMGPGQAKASKHKAVQED